jgi:hypothetical protein
MTHIITIPIAAKRLGISQTRVKQLCIKHSIGQLLPGINGRILAESDLATIEANRGKRGNPTFGPATGNNGGGRKPAKSKRKPTISRKEKK